MPNREGEPLDLSDLAGHYAEGAWYKLAAGLYPGNQGEQRQALLDDLGITLPDAEWDWIEGSYQAAVDKFFWVSALARLAFYNELRIVNGDDNPNSDAKAWMRDAETRSYNDPSGASR